MKFIAEMFIKIITNLSHICFTLLRFFCFFFSFNVIQNLHRIIYDILYMIFSIIYDIYDIKNLHIEVIPNRVHFGLHKI